jgi:hypothetical protein
MPAAGTIEHRGSGLKLVIREGIRCMQVPPVSLFVRLLIVLFLLTGCATSNHKDYGGLIAQLTPARWRQPGTWDFIILDREEHSLGHIVLRLTGEDVGADACDRDQWKRAVVLESSLTFDFGFVVQPAYRVHGRWLTVDLTASMCYADHILDGELDNEGASGFFNYHHNLGGDNIGTFTAVLVDE